MIFFSLLFLVFFSLVFYVHAFSKGEWIMRKGRNNRGIRWGGMGWEGVYGGA